MQRLVAELTRPVVLSDQALRQLARVKDAYGDARRQHGREPTVAELAAGVPSASLNESLGGDEDFSRLEDRVSDPVSESDYESVLDRVAGEQLAGLLGALTDRERDVLGKRHGLEAQEMTLQEVGAELGVSAERVRQIEKRALGKLAAASSI